MITSHMQERQLSKLKLEVGAQKCDLDPCPTATRLLVDRQHV